MNLDIVSINQDYLNYLRYYESKVAQEHQEHKEKKVRPNIAVLIDKEGNKWAIPMSHEEYITNQGKKTGDSFFNIYDKKNNSRCLGHLDINNAIPVLDKTFNSLTKEYKNSILKEDIDYYNLINNQLSIIKMNINAIIKKFNKAFINSRLNKDNEYLETQSLGRRDFLGCYNDFDLLLQKSKNWEFVHNKHNEIINKFTNENVSLSLEDLENLNQDIIKLGKKDFVKVYEYSNVLKENHYEFDVIKKYIQQENVSIFLQKQNNVKDIKIKSFSDYKQEIAMQQKEEEMVKENINRRQEKVPKLKNIFLDKNKSNLVNILDNKETIKETNKTSAKTNKQYDYEREK